MVKSPRLVNSQRENVRVNTPSQTNTQTSMDVI